MKNGVLRCQGHCRSGVVPREHCVVVGIASRGCHVVKGVAIFFRSEGIFLPFICLLKCFVLF